MAEHYPHFQERVRIALKAMLGHEVESRIQIGMAKDGSGVGGELISVTQLFGLWWLTCSFAISRFVCTSSSERCWKRGSNVRGTSSRALTMIGRLWKEQEK